MLTADVLTARRQDLRDQIWSHGPEHFDMAHWVANKEALDFGMVEEVDRFNINDCGTTACMAGHGAILMQAAGIAVKRTDVVTDYFGLDPLAFRIYNWYRIPVGDTTMADLYDGHLASSGDPRLSEWVTVLDYLGHLIKDDGE